MAEERKVYALDEGANKWETMTKEQIITAIMQAVNEGTIGNLDAGFIHLVQEMNKQKTLSFWVGTITEFNALKEKDNDTLYLFTDDPTLDDIETALQTLNDTQKSNVDTFNKKDADTNKRIDNIISGETPINTLNDVTIADYNLVYQKEFDSSEDELVTLKVDKSLLEDNQDVCYAFKLILNLSVTFGDDTPKQFDGIIEIPLFIGYDTSDGNNYRIRFDKFTDQYPTALRRYSFTKIEASGSSTFRTIYTYIFQLPIALKDVQNNNDNITFTIKVNTSDTAKVDYIYQLFDKQFNSGNCDYEGSMFNVAPKSFVLNSYELLRYNEKGM